MILRKSLNLFLFVVISAISLMAQSEPMGIKEARLFDVLVAEKAEFGKIFLAHVWSADDKVQEILLWKHGWEFIQLRVDPTLIMQKSHRDFDGIGFSTKGPIVIPLQYQSGTLNLKIEGGVATIEDSASGKTVTKFTRPQPPWTRHRDDLKMARSYEPSHIELHTHNFSEFTPALENLGPQKVVPLSFELELPAEYEFLKNIILTIPADYSTASSVTMFAKGKEWILAYKASFRGDGNFEFNVGKVTVLISKEKLDDIFSNTFSQDLKIGSKTHRMHDPLTSVHLEMEAGHTQDNGIYTFKNVNMHVWSSANFSILLKGLPPMTDTETHPFISMVRACQKAMAEIAE